MKRIIMLVTVAAMMAAAMALSGVAAWAAPGGNAANAAKCEEGGYLDYTDANGNPFKNEGQCTRYAAKGGQLVPVSTADISLDQAAGTISGTGFTPNSTLTTFLLTYSPNVRRVDLANARYATDATGAFSTAANTFNFCFDSTNTGVEVTVTDSAGVSATESFPLSCGT